MNLPNRLTLLRIILIPLILVFLVPMPDSSFWDNWNGFIQNSGRLIAFFLFAIASITDLLDGHIARKRNLVTTLGKFLDPIADKLLVISVMLVLIQTGRIHSLVVIIVIIREFVITGIRLIGAEKGQVIAAGWLGKAKTVSQIIALLLLLIEPVILSISEGYFEPRILIAVNNSFLMIAVVMTLLSGMQYLYHHRSLLNQPEHDT